MRGGILTIAAILGVAAGGASAAEGPVAGASLDSDGAALVIHEGPDDHESQPIGGAGARIACGAIERR